MPRGLPVFVALALVVAACSVEAPGVRITTPLRQGSLVESETALGRAALEEAAGGGLIDGVSTRVANAAGCPRPLAPGVSDRTVKIGSSVALSGPVQSLTAPAIKSVKAYINATNARGGVHGRKIDLVYMDDGWDAQKGKINIKELVARERVLALTVSSTNGVDAATRYLEEQGVPVLGMSGALASQFSSPVIFPVGPPFEATARIALLDIAQRLKARTLAVIWLDVAIGVEVWGALTKSIRRVAPGLELVAGRRIGLSDPTMEPVWNDIQNQTRNWQRAHGETADGRPDYVLFAIDPASGIKALQAAERLGFRPKIAWGGLGPLFHDIVLTSTPMAVDTGLYAMAPFIPPIPEFEHLPPVREYVSAIRRYVDDEHVLSPIVELGWVAAALTVRALQDAGPCPTRRAVLDAANRITAWSAAGLTLPLTYRPLGQGDGHTANPWAMIVQAIRKGQGGCTRDIGCWRWVKAATPNGWYRDPLPAS